MLTFNFADYLVSKFYTMPFSSDTTYRPMITLKRRNKESSRKTEIQPTEVSVASGRYGGNSCPSVTYTPEYLSNHKAEVTREKKADKRFESKNLF